MEPVKTQPYPARAVQDGPIGNPQSLLKPGPTVTTAGDAGAQAGCTRWQAP